MVQCFVCCRYVNKCCTGNHASLVAILGPCLAVDRLMVLFYLGMRFPVKQTLSIECIHLWARGPMFVSCSNNTSSMPITFLFFSVTMPFLYSSSVNVNTSEESSSLIGDNLGHLGFVGISPRPLTSSWCATLLEVTNRVAHVLFLVMPLAM